MCANIRRSLYRQTAAFRPLQRDSLLGQAKQWEHRAMVELETYFELRNNPLRPILMPSANASREFRAAA